MRYIVEATWAEMLKARRSRMPVLTLVAVSLAPLMGGLFMMILKDPAWARRFGALATKAEASASAADWPTYLGLLTQAAAIGGFVVFGVIVVWVFGREYSDRTVKDLLALPVARETIVAAKFLVVLLWTVGLAVWIYLLGLVMGALIGLPDWSADLALQASVRFVVVAGLTIVLVAPFGWAASAGRGYLPPIGAMFLILFLAQVIAALGLGAYFPWAIPALLSGAAGPAGEAMGPGSYVLALFAGGVGIAGTAAWWRLADQT